MSGALTAMCGIFNQASGGPPYITSIQQVSITIGAAAASNTATISSVNTANTFVIFQGWTGTGAIEAQNNTHCPRVELTNGTTVTAYRNTAATDTVTVNAVIIEVTASLRVSIQHGTVAISAAASATATISSVSTTDSAVFWLGHTTTATATSAATGMTRVTLTDATTVTGLVTTSSTATVGFVVVEFQSAVLQSDVQQFAAAFTSSSATDTQTISSVDPDNTMIAWGGNTTGASNTGDYAALITSATNVNLVRGGTNTTTRTPSYTIVEFAPGVLNSAVQRGAISLISATSNTATISSIDTSLGFANYTGFNFATGTSTTTCSQKLTLTDATTVTASIATSSATAKNTGYEAIEFVS